MKQMRRSGVGQMSTVYEHAEESESDSQDLRMCRGEGVSTGVDVEGL